MAGQRENLGPTAMSYSTWVPRGYETITGLDGVKTLDAEKYNGASFALIQAVGADVTWRDDGTDPSANSGMVLVAGASPWCYRGDFSKIRFIQTAATATLRVYYGRPM